MTLLGQRIDATLDDIDSDTLTKAINVGMQTVRFFSHCRVLPSYFDSLFFSNLQYVSRLLLPLVYVNSRIEVNLSMPMKLRINILIASLPIPRCLLLNCI